MRRTQATTVTRSPYREAMAKHPRDVNIKPGLSVAALLYGLLVLVLFGYGAAGFGVGVVEIVVWLALVAGWVGIWMVKRRR